MKLVKLTTLMGIVLFLAVIASMAHGADVEDEREHRFTIGVINKYNGSSFLVNEGLKVYIVHDTKFFDDRGNPATGKGLRESRWVYVEGPLNADGSINAESLYLLRGPVGKKDKRKYPFIQIP